MPVACQVKEPCPRCGKDFEVWLFEKVEETISKDCYICEMCGCEWTEVRQD